jgi:protease I
VIIMKKMIIFLVIAMFLFAGVHFVRAEEAPAERILAIIASRDFKDEELFIPKKIFEENGYKVVIASSSSKPSRGAGGAEVKPDILLKDVDVDDYAAIVFIGGPGASEYWNNRIAQRIAQEAVKRKKVLAAICIAPVTLANAGVLSHKKATVWFSQANTIIKKGAFYTGSAVEQDGDIITANGPSAASEFANTILKVLASK